jgi:hypothetical protein
MLELDETREAALAECLNAIDAGADIEVCLARYPEHAQALHLYLELRTELLTLGRRPEPPAEVYQAGRLTLLEQVATPPSKTTGRALVHAFGLRWRLFGEQMRAFAAGGWDRLASPLARVAAVGAVLVLVGGGALGASAAGGFEPARQVLSALHLVDPPSEEGEDLSPQDAGEAGPVDTDSELGGALIPIDGEGLDPRSEEEPTPAEQPALAEPVLTEEPIGREEPTAEEEPARTEDPLLKETPVIIDVPGREEEPTLDEEPALTN